MIPVTLLLIFFIGSVANGKTGGTSYIIAETSQVKVEAESQMVLGSDNITKRTFPGERISGTGSSPGQNIHRNSHIIAQSLKMVAS